MSALIGYLKGPVANGARDVASVWASTAGVEIHLDLREHQDPRETLATYDPLVARNFAALLVRGSEEVERMRVKHLQTEIPGCEASCETKR